MTTTFLFVSKDASEPRQCHVFGGNGEVLSVHVTQLGHRVAY